MGVSGRTPPGKLRISPDALWRRRGRREAQKWMLAEIMSEVTEAPVILQPAKSEDKLEIEKEEAGEKEAEKVEQVGEKAVESDEKVTESDEKAEETKEEEKAEEKPAEVEESEVKEEKEKEGEEEKVENVGDEEQKDS